MSKNQPLQTTNEDSQQEAPMYKLESGEWGHLPQEPCRACHRIGGVHFDASDGPESRRGHETVRCNYCGNVWYPGESTA